MKKLNVAILILTLLCITLPPIFADESSPTDHHATNLPDQSLQAQVTANNVSQNTQDVPGATSNQACFVYSYVPNQIYKVYCSENRITDIQLQPGEEIVYIGGADTIRWIIDKDVSGSGAFKQWHIFIKPQKPDLTTNFVITTDRHTYHLDVYAKSWCTPIINWAYPQEERLAILRQEAKQHEAGQHIIPMGQDSMSLEDMNFKYKIDGRNYPWKPVLVFDDGSKTYIQMPVTMKSSEAPALFIKDGRDLLLVNYRVKSGYYIVDRLFDEAEMRNGPKENIRLKKLKP